MIREDDCGPFTVSSSKSGGEPWRYKVSDGTNTYDLLDDKVAAYELCGKLNMAKDITTIEETFCEPPLTKRERFAAMAMQGLLSDASTVEHLTAIAQQEKIEMPKVLSETALGAADALIAELNKEGV